jgi:c-di-GMP-binding flagellar brake protein YcgR
MNAKNMIIGSKIEIRLFDNLYQKSDYVYVSQLLDIIDEKNIIAAYPIHESRLLFIPNGAKVEVVIIQKKHGLFSFIGTVVSKSNKDNVASMQIQIETEIIKIQRREFFRLTCFLDVRYRILSDPSQENNPESGSSKTSQEFMKAMTSDLSGSGVCIITDTALPEGSLIELEIKLDDVTTVKAAGNIIRSYRDENQRKTKFKNGIHFVGLSKADRDQIIKYLFNLQRELLKKGLHDNK